ncbi:GIY-YIG nuclease family protein [Maribacter chungangensis]|uniref:GIY-YIG nuclease family protein n=1 Tax=Maribacter chungangensis TaxID=1069117 RepID=A0ABW3B6C2_9FLAO
MEQEVVNAILNSKLPMSKIQNLPDNQGIYAYFLDTNKDLNEFGDIGDVIYVGLAVKSLQGRDTMTHLSSGKTGWSSFRRSLGAILKERLNLIAIKRDKNGTKPRPDKYKFTEDGELKLTQWMMTNLKFGYWENQRPFDKENLRSLEEKVILRLRPKLDLDRRTRNKNPNANLLDNYRAVCREEVKSKFK